MKKVKLYDVNGIHITTVNVPGHINSPDVIIWKERVFICDDIGEYYEGSVFMALNEPVED